MFSERIDSVNHKNYCTVVCALTICLGAFEALGQTISSFTPTYGKAGSIVRVFGANFVNGTTKIYFNGTLSPKVSVTATTQLEATVPASMTPGYISVPNGSGGLNYSQASFTNITTAPFIVDFSPYSGAGGTAVALTGVNFTGASAVKFADVAATFTKPTTDTQLNAVAPNNVLTGPITVTTSLGSYSTWNNFYGKPVITSFAPWSGRAGTNVTINGTNFLGATSVLFGGVSTPFTIVSNNKITTTVPEGASKGAITVTTPSMPFPTSSNFVVLPLISDFSPTLGPVGTTVTITGSNMKLGTTNPVVKFNGVAAVATNSTATTIIVTVPWGATSGPITVGTSDGTNTSASSFYLPPTITSYSPIRALPGTTVTVIGQNLTDMTDVSFAGTSASFTFVNPTNATAIVPNTAKTGALTLTTPGGTVNAGLFYIPPVINGFSPTAGLAGAMVTITGAFPDLLTGVQFNGVTATFTNLSTNTVNAYVPTNASTGPITVKSGGGTNTSASNFQFLVPALPPQITSFSPTFGPVGTVVTIKGTNLNLGAVTVDFNGTNATPTSLSLTQLTVKVPAGAVSGLITVNGRDGSATTATNFLLPPVITGFSPTNGSAGTIVTLTGTNFTNAASLLFNGADASFTVVNNNQLTATVPDAASSGPIRLITPAGTNDTGNSFQVPPTITSFSPASGLVGSSVVITGFFPDGASSVSINGVTAPITSVTTSQITITVPDGAGTGFITVSATGGADVSATKFTTIIPVLPPVITSFTPTQGPIGTVVTIRGSNLNQTPVTVKFNTTVATPTTVTGGKILAPVPAGASSGPITITTKDGSFTTDISFRLPPVITGFLPGTALPGSSVIITGSDFTNATRVAFGGVSTTYRVVNNQEIIATVPVNAPSGPITVTTPAGANTSSGSFLIPPVITTFTPASGALGTTVNLSGLFPDTVTNVLFNGVSGVITLANTSQIQAVVPTNATTGVITVQAAGGSDQSADPFTITVPNLFIARASASSINILWTGATAYVLQYVTNLSGTNFWLTDTNTAKITNGVSTVTAPATGARRVYRLKTP